MSLRCRCPLVVAIGFALLTLYLLFSSDGATGKSVMNLGDQSTITPFSERDTLKRSVRGGPPTFERAPKLMETFVPLSQEEMAGVEKFVLFVGYARSGHSIIGSYLDAHPNIVIAHEFMIFKKWLSSDVKIHNNKSALFNELHRVSFNAALNGIRTAGKDKKGYDLKVNNSWQGQFKKLKVLGDKSGGMAAILYTQNPARFQQMYHEIARTVQIPIYAIHVIRNPFDIISTQFLYQMAKLEGQFGRKYKPDNGSKATNIALLHTKINAFFRHANSILEMTKTCKLHVLDVHSERLIQDPKAIMQKICNFLEVECTSEFLQMCFDKTFKSVSRTRDRVVWLDTVIASVEKGLQEFPFLQGYSFEGDFFSSL